MQRWPVAICAMFFGWMALAILASVPTRAQDQQHVCAGQHRTLEALIACVQSTYLDAGRLDAAACAARTVSRVPPVAGRRVHGYGVATRNGLSRGVLMETAPGATVLAPMAGRLLFAGTLRSYGPVVVLDADCQSVSVLVGVVSTNAARGQRIAAGDAIGAMQQASAPEPPLLYYELRVGGRAFDPE
jgi:septal ring factor EnvC (AmiA/AmiB activator)